MAFRDLLKFWVSEQDLDDIQAVFGAYAQDTINFIKKYHKLRAPWDSKFITEDQTAELIEAVCGAADDMDWLIDEYEDNDTTDEGMYEAANGVRQHLADMREIIETVSRQKLFSSRRG